MKTFLAITAVVAFAAGFAATSVTANAAGFLKIGDIKGEAANGAPGALPTAKRQHKPFTITKGNSAQAMIGGMKHNSDQVSKAYGINVASGDVTGDGKATKAHGRVRGGLNPADTVQAPQDEEKIEKGHARVRGGLNPANTVQAPQAEQQAEKGYARVRGGLNPATDIKAPEDDSEIGLLLPAVQKAH